MEPEMSDIYDNDISFTVKFLGRVEVVRPDGLQVIDDASKAVQVQEKGAKDKGKKNKVSLFISNNGIDVLEYKTKFMLHSCLLSSISFCGLHQAVPSLFGFVAQHPIADVYHCYLFKSNKFSHLLVTLIGDLFRSRTKDENVRGSRDLVVEALRHKNKLLVKENDELRRRLAALTGNKEENNVSPGQGNRGDLFNVTTHSCPDMACSEHQSELAKGYDVKFHVEDDRLPLLSTSKL